MMKNRKVFKIGARPVGAVKNRAYGVCSASVMTEAAVPTTPHTQHR